MYYNHNYWFGNTTIVRHHHSGRVESFNNYHMKLKMFSEFRFLGPFFKFFRKSHFFQELSILACRPHDIRNPLIESNKKKKNLKFYPTAVYRWGHLSNSSFSFSSLFFSSSLFFIY